MEVSSVCQLILRLCFPAEAIRYEITGGNVGEVFLLDPESGILSVAAPLDYETKKQASLVGDFNTTQQVLTFLLRTLHFIKVIPKITKELKYLSY